MHRIDLITPLRKQLDSYRAKKEKIALVPTMGNLHAGHLSLIEEARRHADRVVVSIFVNPAQFERADDLAAYPRTLGADLEALQDKEVDIAFCPEAKEVYPAGKLITEVDVPAISGLLEGASRPGHFCGVATVVCKLLNIARPDVAVFGEKDFQQLMLIRQMVADLNMPVQIVGVPTMRESDGLAMSSRNNRLSDEQRSLAPEFSRVLRELVTSIESGEDCLLRKGQVSSLFLERLMWAMFA